MSCGETFFPEGPMLNYGTKNVKFVEDHPMNIHVQFGKSNDWKSK